MGSIMGTQQAHVASSPPDGFWRGHGSTLPTPAPALVSLTLHGEHSLGANLPGAVPGLAGVSARVLREHLLDAQAVPSAPLFKVEVLRLLDLVPVVKPDDLRGWVP